MEETTHPPECPWHKDWHSCNCGVFDPVFLYTPHIPLQITTYEELMNKHVKLIAKPDTWFKEGTEVCNYNSTLNNRIPISIEEYEEAKRHGIISARGFRISEDYESEAIPVGEEYFDGEECSLDEFDIEIKGKPPK